MPITPWGTLSQGSKSTPKALFRALSGPGVWPLLYMAARIAKANVKTVVCWGAGLSGTRLAHWPRRPGRRMRLHQLTPQNATHLSKWRFGLGFVHLLGQFWPVFVGLQGGLQKRQLAAFFQVSARQIDLLHYLPIVPNVQLRKSKHGMCLLSNAHLFIILFARNLRRVCSQLWLSIHNSG